MLLKMCGLVSAEKLCRSILDVTRHVQTKTGFVFWVGAVWLCFVHITTIQSASYPSNNIHFINLANSMCQWTFVKQALFVNIQ